MAYTADPRSKVLWRSATAAADRRIDIGPGKTIAAPHCRSRIGAGAERLVSRPGQYDDAPPCRQAAPPITLGDARDHIAIERVTLLRPVMVIQKTCPCFSSMTPLSLIALSGLACCRRTLTADGDVPQGRDLSGRRCRAFTQTLLSWKERHDRRHRFGAGKRIDAAPPIWALFDGLIWRSARARNPSNNLAVIVVSAPDDSRAVTGVAVGRSRVRRHRPDGSSPRSASRACDDGVSLNRY